MAPQPDGTAKTALFGLCNVAFVPHRSLDPATIAKDSETITKYGGSVLAPLEDGKIDVANASHIISNTIDFPQYEEADAYMIPVVHEDWIVASLKKGKQAAIRPYSPDPRMIFSSVNVSCAGDIPRIDAEVILGATMAMGGTESKDLTKLTTHICALTMESDKVKAALRKGLKCKIVLPHWFDDCFKLGKRIDEEPYLTENPLILQGPAAAEDVQDIPESARRPTHTKTVTVFKNKKVMISADLQLSPSHQKVVEELVENGGGEIIADVDTCDMFICQYRDGPQYVRAAQAGKDVGNLAWLFYLIAHDSWCSPRRRLLHYPLPRDGLPGFRDMKITVSNYGGEARTYLENLIIASGATFTKTMKAENTHLITARQSGDKCEAAKDWNIHIVNHLWLEESYAKCEVLSITNPKYTHFPHRTNLGEVIGLTMFDESKLHDMFYPGGEKTLTPAGKRKRKIMESAHRNAYQDGPAEGVTIGRQEHQELDVMKDDEATYIKKSADLFGVPAPPRGTRNFATPARRYVQSGKENDTPSVVSSGSRSAKDKALSNLHHLVSDIALYEKEKKRASKNGPWGGKRAANQYEREQEAAKLSSPSGEPEEMDEDDEESKRPAKKAKKTLPPIEMRILVTGFARWLGPDFSKEDVERRKLRKLGIQLVQLNQAYDYLAAPKLVRTEKFLLALAKGPEIISTQFIDDVLDQGKMLPVEEYGLKDKANEDKLQVNLQTSLQRARALKGHLLTSVPIYCTADCKNYESFQAIAEANGATFKQYKARSGTTIKPTTAEEDEGKAPDPVYLLSGSKESEKMLWPKFEKMARDGHMEPRIVHTDWLLDVAIQQEVYFDETYLMQNRV